MDKEKIWEEILANPSYSRNVNRMKSNIENGKNQLNQRKNPNILEKKEK